MNTKDAVYYAGLMGGLLVGTLVLRSFGVGGILQLVGGLVVGVGCGYLAEQACSNPKSSKHDDFGPEDVSSPDPLRRSCPNPECNWSDIGREARCCPQCGSLLS